MTTTTNFHSQSFIEAYGDDYAEFLGLVDQDNALTDWFELCDEPATVELSEEDLLAFFCED